MFVLCRRAGRMKWSASHKLWTLLWTHLSGKDSHPLLFQDSPSIASASYQISCCVTRLLCHQPRANGQWQPSVCRLFRLSFIQLIVVFTFYWTARLGDGLQLAVTGQLNPIQQEISNCGCQLTLVFIRCLILCSECLTLSVESIVAQILYLWSFLSGAQEMTKGVYTSK